MNTVTAITNARTRKEWAEVINADWRKSIEGIIQTGRDLAAAEKELSRSDFREMIESDLLFKTKTAQQLMRIARDPRIANEISSNQSLPASWRVLSALTPLSKEDFADARRHDLINPDTSLRAAVATTSAYKAPDGAIVGKNVGRASLPSPSEASNIARATGRMVTASDGHVYSGASEEEGEDHVRRRQQTYGVIDAINTLADCPVKPPRWANQAETHWLHNFELGSVDAAINWLSDLREPLAQKKKVINAK
jgi:hypothetical protein